MKIAFKNVNFVSLEHFGQRVLTTCVWYDQVQYTLGAYKYVSHVPSPQISRQEIQNSYSHDSGSKILSQNVAFGKVLLEIIFWKIL